MNLTGIRRKPSSYSSRVSQAHPEPPMSGRCAMEPEKPTSLPRWKIGDAMVTSGRWPDPSQGSLVMMQSPGRQRSTGMRSSIAFTVLGTIPTKDGMPPVFSARQLHSASSSTVVKSFDSLTTVENAVRSSAAADSSAIEIRRDHRISRVTGSNRGFGVAFT